MKANSSKPNNNVQSEETPSVLESIKQPVGQVVQVGQQKASQAAGQLKEGLYSSLNQQKGKAAETVSLLCDSLNQMSTQLSSQAPQIGGYVQSGHQYVQQLSSYLNERELDEIAADVRLMARRQPGLFVGGIFALGFLAGRFLRSSAPPSYTVEIPRERSLAVVEYETPVLGATTPSAIETPGAITEGTRTWQ